jgi:hypothetical protein
MKIQHTPTPWQHDTLAGKTIIYADSGIQTHLFYGAGYYVGRQNEANAAHIVHCVNTHDAYRSAAEALEQVLTQLDTADESCLSGAIRERAYAALNQVAAAKKDEVAA